MTKGLSERQKQFIELAGRGDTSATAAARAVGYSHPGDEAKRLMRNPRVRGEIERRRTDRRDEVTADHAWVRERLIGEALEAPESSARIRALELLGKHLVGFFPKDAPDVNVAVLPTLTGLSFEQLKELAGVGDWPEDVASARAYLNMPESGNTVGGDAREFRGA